MGAILLFHSWNRDKRDLSLISDTRIVGSILHWCSFKTMSKKACLCCHGRGMTTPIRKVISTDQVVIVSIVITIRYSSLLNKVEGAQKYFWSLSRKNTQHRIDFQIRHVRSFVSSDRSSCTDDGPLYIRGGGGGNFFRF